MRKPTLKPQDKYIQKVINRHQDRYDLSKIEYVNSVTPITVICKVHGEFQKNPSELLRDGGCPKCGNDSKKSDWDEIRARFEKQYDNAFDYTNSYYINSKTDMEVRCIEHDVIFTITPANHRRFGGCPACREEGYGQHLKLTKDEYVTKARAMHGNYYDYTNSDYQGYMYPFNITCKLHGEFTVLAKHHLRGSGCLYCRNTRPVVHEVAELSKILTNNTIKKDYLLEESLGDFLKSRFKYPVTSPRLNWDEGLFLPDFVIEDLKLIVEYDGPRHYTQSSTILRDGYKKEMYSKHGYKLINIPYFVQLDERVIRLLFGEYREYMNSMEAYNSYPHGFISPKVLLPADFCSIGATRFVNQIDTTFSPIKEDIIKSLESKINNKRTRHEVFPENMLS